MTPHDWSEKNESIVVQQVSAIAIFTNPRGDVVILQHGEDQDESVIFSRAYLKQIIAGLRAI